MERLSSSDLYKYFEGEPKRHIDFLASLIMFIPNCLFEWVEPRT